MTSRTSVPGHPRPELHEHADEASWVESIVSDAASALRHDVSTLERGRVLVSGGTTPAPVYRALAHALSDWNDIDVALVDERWLPPGHPESNARLVSETLLTGRVACAHFEPILVANRSFEQSVRVANDSATLATVAFLGMGPDGHTASLFPHMQGLREALESQSDYIGVDAGDSPGAAPWPRRISLTPTGLAKARLRLLLVRGEHKRELVLKALDGVDALELPVRAALFLPGLPTRIHWCP